MAAILVVLYHVARHLDKALGLKLLTAVLQFGHAGVDFFFVLSGFVILYAHQADIGRPSRLQHYVGRRFTRVLPIYWVTLAASICLEWAAGHGGFVLPRLLASFIPIPSTADMIVGGAWSLQHELLFYAVFACCILNRRAGALVLAVWLGLTLAGTYDATVAERLPMPQLASPYTLEFFMGMSAAWLLRRRAIPNPWAVLTTGLLLFGAAALAEDWGTLDGYAQTARLAYGATSTLMVLSLVELERRHAIRAPWWLRHLGSASYSIYLFQFILIGLSWQGIQALHLQRIAPASALFILLALSATLGGIVASRWIEQPLIRITRRPTRSRDPQSTRTTAAHLSHSYGSHSGSARTPVAP